MTQIIKTFGKHLSVLFLLFFLISPHATNAQDQTPIIRLNQIGFYPNSNKIAIISPATQETTFQVVNTKSGKVVFKGTLSESKLYELSGKTAKSADFSSLQKPGEYVVEIKGVQKSFPFEIRKDIHQEIVKGSLKGFYFIRASTPIEEKYAGKWARPLAHPDDSVIIHGSAATEQRPEGTVVSSSKGWYDAGDYNKYVVNSGITVATMLSFYEDFPEYSKSLVVNIPESSNNVPDILDENLWNIRWMLTMQDPNDGGVYHKCTEAKFSGFVMPEELKEVKRYLVQKSTAAALDFAATMAQSARIFKKFEKDFPGLADSCLSAAEQAWNWSIRNPEVLYKQHQFNQKFDPDITTGAYPGHPLEDEWIWAACELYITNPKKDYLDKIKYNEKKYFSVPAWAQVSMLGYYSLLRFEDQLTNFPKNGLSEIKKNILLEADSLATKVLGNPYKTPMGTSPRDFIWGSNSVAANQGILLVYAYKWTSDPKYLNGALSNLDYLLGRNATNFCYLTGFGDKPTMNPHQRQSGADKIKNPVPGLLAGGPNPGQQDKCEYPSKYPAESYSDTECSYASNEIAINWNSPMVYLSGAMEALQYKVGYSKK